MPSNVFERVVFRPGHRPPGTLGESDEGRLTITESAVHFWSRRSNLRIQDIVQITLEIPTPGLASRWIKIDFTDDAGANTVYFADQSAVGWGGAAQSTERIFESMRSLLHTRRSDAQFTRDGSQLQRSIAGMSYAHGTPEGGFVVAPCPECKTSINISMKAISPGGVVSAEDTIHLRETPETRQMPPLLLKGVLDKILAVLAGLFLLLLFGGLAQAVPGAGLMIGAFILLLCIGLLATMGQQWLGRLFGTTTRVVLAKCPSCGSLVPLSTDGRYVDIGMKTAGKESPS